MTTIKHWAIYFGHDSASELKWVKNLLSGKIPSELSSIENKTGVYFSTSTLEKYIYEEKFHDDFCLSEEKNRSLLTFSSGEQRKALLNHLLLKNPGFLVVDHVFDMLDASSISEINNKLLEFSKTISIIQIVKRKKNVLPFIHHALVINKNEIIYSGNMENLPELSVSTPSFSKQMLLPTGLQKVEKLSNPLIKFINVTVKYGEQVIVNNINWTINKNEFWQLKGPNGSGKTTLLTLITGDNPKAYNQEIYLFGKKRGSGESIWDIKKYIGFVTPAMVSMFRGWNTVEKMVISGLFDSVGLYKKPTEIQRFMANEWLKLLRMENQKHTRFSNLSETKKRMVLIARAMIKHPPLLILDEPAHALDDYNASVMGELINNIFKEKETSIIYVSHREEPGLNPQKIIELIPGKFGSEHHIPGFNQ